MPGGAAFASQTREVVWWLLQWVDRAAFRLTKPGSLPGLALRTDASATGFGALLLQRTTLEPFCFWADAIAAGDVAIWGVPIPRPRSNGRLGTPGLAGLRGGLEPEAPDRSQRSRVAAGQQGTLGAASKITSPGPALNALAKELALALEICAAETMLGEHYRGTVDVVADALSRPAEGAQLPARLRGAPRVPAPGRSRNLYVFATSRLE